MLAKSEFKNILMKTAIHTAIDMLIELSTQPGTHSSETFNAGYMSGIIKAQQILVSKLKTEKEQIIDAYWAGIDGSMGDYSNAKFEGGTLIGHIPDGGAEKYFKDKYYQDEK